MHHQDPGQETPGHSWEGAGGKGLEREEKEKKENHRARRGRPERSKSRGQQQIGQNRAVGEARLGASRPMGNGRLGQGEGRERGHEESEGLPYHHTAELPLLTSSLSLPGGILGAAANINQNHSDYGPPQVNVGYSNEPRETIQR